MRQQLKATWTRECYSISPQYIPTDSSEAERQHAIDSAVINLLSSLQGSLRGVDPTTIRFVLEDIE